MTNVSYLDNNPINKCLFRDNQTEMCFNKLKLINMLKRKVFNGFKNEHSFLIRLMWARVSGCQSSGMRFSLAVSQFRASILRSAHLKWNYVAMLCEGCPNLSDPPNAAHKYCLLFPLSGGRTATILCGYKLPKIHYAPEEKK